MLTSKVGTIMKRCILLTILLVAALLTGCTAQEPQAQIAATTLPVYEMTARLCDGTDLTITQLVTEAVSCLHDYALNVRQVRAAEAAELIVISGAGLEDFMEDLLHDKSVIDSSVGIALIEGEAEHDHGHEEESHEGHHHETDPHIWLSPENAKTMAQNICDGLCAQYPAYSEIFKSNLEFLLADLNDLQAYGESQLETLSCRELITFHDGFAYLADSFDLTILEAV